MPIKNELKFLRDAPVEQLRQVRALFFDIDDTFSGSAGASVSGVHTHDPRISATAYNALWKLKDAGLDVVPVTGRPAGWCDMIARMWPVTAVVGENGAFYSYVEAAQGRSRMVKKYLESGVARAKNAEKLKKLHRDIAKNFPGAKVPSDQPFREFDLAIDYCEDVPRWTDKKVQSLIELCRARGAQAKLSSIHVNTWYGRYDKLTCARRVLKNLLHIDPEQDILEVLYVGDSPNDEPFFANLPFTVGVANVRRFLDRMKYGPAYVTEKESGDGFAELASRLLESRA